MPFECEKAMKHISQYLSGRFIKEIKLLAQKLQKILMVQTLKYESKNILNLTYDELDFQESV